MTISKSHDKQIQFLGLGLLFSLYLVWQLPNVVALRYFLLLGLFILFVPAGARGIYRTLATATSEPSSKPVFIAYALFIAWLFFIAIGIAAEPDQSLMEIEGQWLPPTLCLLIGFGTAFTYSSRQTSVYLPVRIAYWALVAHAVLQLIVAAWTIYYDGSLPPGNFGGISDHKANVTYTNVLALALLLTDWAFTSGGVRFLGLGLRIQSIVFGILLISTFVSVARNGVIVFLLLTVIGAAVIALRYKRQAPRRGWAILAVCSVVLVVGGWLALKADSRWERFMATVPVAWDIDGNFAWVNSEKYPVPLAADGQAVDVSAYERIAFAHAALKFISQHPLGTQVSRDAFKSLVSTSYEPTAVGHPHNGYLELAVSVGLPGLALWVTFLGTMIWLGYRSFQSWKNPAGIALLMVVLGFALRSLLDSIVRDHIIQEFMLTSGLLLGCIERARADKGPIAPR